MTLRHAFAEFQSRPGHYTALALLILIGVLIRARYLDQPIRYDEALTYLDYASQPVSVIVSTYNEPNNHIFHSILVHLSTQVFGNSPATLRIPAFIAGVLILPALYVVSQRLFNPATALVAVALAAVSMSLVEFSVLARGYSIVTLMFILLVGLADRLRSDPDWIYWVLFALLAALGLYTIPVMVYPLGVVALWLLLLILREPVSRRGRTLFRFIVTMIGAALLTGVLYLPLLRTQGLGVLVGNQFVAQPNAAEFYQRLPYLLETLFGFPLRGVPWGLAVIIVLGALLAWLLNRQISRAPVSLARAAVLWLVPVLLLQRVIPFDRTWLFLAPLLFMLGAAGITYVLSRREGLATVAAFGVIALMGVPLVTSQAIETSDQIGNVPDAEAAALFLGQLLQPGDEVLAASPVDEPIHYYLDLHGFSDVQVRNDFQTHWVDLRAPTTPHHFVIDATSANLPGFLTTYRLPEPEIEVNLRPLRTFGALTLQQLVIPPYPTGILFQADFETWGTDGMLIHGMEALPIFDRGNRGLALTTTDSWGEILLDGGSTWTDYAVEARIKLLTEAPPELQDLFVNLRFVPNVAHYTGSLSIAHQQVEISGDLNGAWRGSLGTAPFEVELGRWYALRFEAKGRLIRLFVDGVEQMSIEDDATRRGTVRLQLPPGMRAHMDDLRVIDLTPG